MAEQADAADVRIRPAGRSDLTAILDIFAETGLDGGERLSPVDAERAFERLAAHPDHTVYVAIDKAGAIAGTYALTVIDTMIRGGLPFALVEQVGVATASRGLGIGRLMMHHAMDLARARRCYKLMLSSHVTFTGAHAFYDSLGFERHGYSFVVDLA